MATFAERMALRAEEARLTRLAAALPAPGSKPLPPPAGSKPLPPPAGSTPISSEPGAGAGSEKEYAPILPRVGSDFMAKVNSLIARFESAEKPVRAFAFFDRFCTHAHTQAGYDEIFTSKFPVKRGLAEWQARMLAIAEGVKRKIASDELNSYNWIRGGMQKFEDEIIVSIKRLFRDQAFPERFFTNLLNEYEISREGRMYLTGVGGKRRKTRKVRKSKRQTKLRIKKRLIMS